MRFLGKDDVGPSMEGPLRSLHAGNRHEIWRMMKKDLLWTEAKDVWYLFLDPVWADFHGTPSADNRPVPLVDAFPVCLWLYKEPDEESPRMKKARQQQQQQQQGQQAKMHILGSTGGLVSAQLNHFQLLFLLRTVEMISEITTFLTEDVRHILGEEDEGSVAVGLLAPQVDLSLLMPAVSQSRDAVGGDLDDASAAGGRPVGGEVSSVYSAGDLAAALAAAADSHGGGDSAAATLANLTTASSASSTPLPSEGEPEEPTARSVLESPQRPPPSFAASGPPSLPQNASAPVLAAVASSSSTSPSRPVPSISLQQATTPPSTSQSSASLVSTPSKQKNLPPTGATAKKNSLTSSLTNMMASLDTSIRQVRVNPTYISAIVFFLQDLLYRKHFNPLSSSQSGGRSPLDEDDEVSIRSDGSSDSSESYVMISQNAATLEAASARESFDNALFNIQTGHAVRGATFGVGGAAARDPSPALEYAMEVTEDSLAHDRSGTPSESGRSSGRHTPRPVPSERAASIHEPQVVVRRERTVRA